MGKFERSEGMVELEGHRVLALPQSQGHRARNEARAQSLISIFDDLEVASSSASISESSVSTSSTDMIEVEVMASRRRPLLSL